MHLITTSTTSCVAVPSILFDTENGNKRIGFVPSSPSDRVMTYSRKPKQGSNGFKNEKAVSHDNYRGDVFLLPTSVVTNKSFLSTPRRLMTITEGTTSWYETVFRIGTVDCCAILRQGQSYSRTMPRFVYTQGSYTYEELSSRCVGTWVGDRTFLMYVLTVKRMKKTSAKTWGKWQTYINWTYCSFSLDWASSNVQQWSTTIDGQYFTPFEYHTFVLGSYTNNLLNYSFSGSSNKRLPRIPTYVELRHYIPQPSFDWWGNLAARAADDARALNINTSVSLYQLKDLLTVIYDFRNALKRPSPKTWGKAYLAYQYGLASTVRDAQAAVAALESSFPVHAPYSIVRARASNPILNHYGSVRAVSDLFCYKIFYNPNQYHQFEKSLRDWGFWLSVTNVWDLIPYSFVADWFLNLQQFTEHYDRKQYYDTVDVLGVTKSRRTEIRFQLSNQDWVACSDASYVFYTRTCQSETDETFLLFQSPHTFNNWAEGASLILSKSRV